MERRLPPEYTGWQEHEAQADKVYIYDLNGDGLKDAVFEQSCCGATTIGAVLNKGSKLPKQSKTASWLLIPLPVRPNEKSKYTECKNGKGRKEPGYRITGVKHGSCKEFQIDLIVTRCDEKSPALIRYDCGSEAFLLSE